tara:strand:- start:1118 stop:1834 length:717 start_codon:yes stop_codon:yes gene_type:complete
MEKFNIFKHYKNLIFFAFNRFKENNYSLMRYYFAEILILDLKDSIDLNSKKIIDIGGDTGEISKHIGEKFDCDVVNLEPERKETVWKTVKGTADQIPYQDSFFDLVLFRNVLEHIPPNKQQESINEIYRVLKKDGYGYFVIPPWYSFHGGHHLKPFHILPFKMAKFLRNIFFKMKFEENSLEEAMLFKITYRKMSKMILNSGFEIMNTKDTHFRFHFLTKIPLIREFTIPAVAFIVKK